MAVKKGVALRPGAIYNSPGGATNSGRLDIEPWPWSEVPRLHLKRARDCEGGSAIACCADFGGGSNLAGGGGGRSHKIRNIQNSPQKRRFPRFIDLKIARNAIFYSKELNKIYFQDFLRNT
jgi:hypothetical protein